MSAVEPNELRLASLAEQPDLADRFWPQKERIWPGFMFEDKVADALWRHLHDDFASYQLYLLAEADAPVAVAQTVPLAWNGTLDDLPVGWDDGFVRAIAGLQNGAVPNALMGLEIAIQPEYQGKGISYRMVQAVRQRAADAGLQGVIVAVRPSLKSRYPLASMARYVRWQVEDGAPFDPWLRVHWRCGGEILKIAHPSMVIEGTVAEWEQWTGLAFPESGDYVVPGALCPIEIDRTMDMGRYIEPNIWVHHPLNSRRLVSDHQASPNSSQPPTTDN